MIIYKATNLINNKIYIGQTIRTLNARKSDHFYRAFKANSEQVFHKALRKYGKENFKWEIIDTADAIEALDEKEIYWIWFYNSYVNANDSNGYNMTLGGEATFGYKRPEESTKKITEKVKNNGSLKGSKNPNTLLVEDDILQIKELIKLGMHLSEIAKKFNVSYSIISKIKRGKSWKHVGEDLSYLKYQNSIRLTEDEVKEIKLLLNSGMKQKEIAKKFGVSASTICVIKKNKFWRNITV